MTITTEEAERMARRCSVWKMDKPAAALRSLAAERDALKAAINEALTKELPIEGGTWSQEPIGPNETPGEAIRRLIKHRVQIGRQAERDALRAENARLREALAKTTKILVAAFNRIHGLPQTRDTELSAEIEKCLGEIRRVREETQ
jgi:hypothetical protein